VHACVCLVFLLKTHYKTIYIPFWNFCCYRDEIFILLMMTYRLYVNVHSGKLKLLNAISYVSMMSTRKLLREMEVLDILVVSDMCLN
jgi:hypothetical protein